MNDLSKDQDVTPTGTEIPEDDAVIQLIKELESQIKLLSVEKFGSMKKPKYIGWLAVALVMYRWVVSLFKSVISSLRRFVIPSTVGVEP